jgi:hypothetical protein
VMKMIIGIIIDMLIRGSSNKEIKMTMRIQGKTIVEGTIINTKSKNTLRKTKALNEVKIERVEDIMAVSELGNSLNRIMTMMITAICKMITKINKTTIECMMKTELERTKDKVEKVDSVSQLKTSKTGIKMMITMKTIIVLS